jgi:hypothetical protein
MKLISEILTKFMDRLKRSWLTTVIGVLIIAASIASHFVYETSWTEVLMGVVIGFIFLPMKDPKKPSGGAAAVILIALMSLSSCVTYNKCVDKFGSVQTDTITITQIKPVDITFKPEKESFTTSLRLDSLLWAEPGKERTIHNEDSTVNIKIKKDANNDRVSITAECDPDTVRITKEVPVEVKVPCETKTFTEPEPTGLTKAWQQYKGVSAIALPIVIILIIIIKR